MNHTHDRADMKLPVTAEVGSEGGSYGNATMQVATFEGDEPRHDRPMNEGQPSGETDNIGGLRRYPTEPPAPPAGETSTRSWRAGLVGAAAGAAAGAAVAYGLIKRRDRREG